jgi:benzoate transport
MNQGHATPVNADPRETLANSPMSRMQILVVGITIILNALDGFDVLSISIASNGILQEWGIGRDTLGFVLTMELIGMAVGSIVLGGLADKIGRRPLMLGCLVVMASGMLMVTTTTSLVVLSIWRVITGLGIGGMLAAINAVAAEYSSAKRKHLSVSLMAIGYPVGVVVGGSISAVLLRHYEWRSVFYLGATMTALCIPLVYFWIPETVDWLARKRPDGALEKINASLKRMGHATVSALPEVAHDAPKPSVLDIFKPGLIATTLIVAAAYFFHITTFYFVVKWAPQITVDMGFSPSQGSLALTWAMVGGALGGATLGFLTLRYGLKALTIGMLILSTAMVMAFGSTASDLTAIYALCFAAGFCTNAAIVGLYAIFAHAYPTHVRATGTGFAIGVGRGGSVVGPVVAGFLFEGGVALPIVALILGVGSLVAAVLLFFLKLRPDRPAVARERHREEPEGVPATS